MNKKMIILAAALSSALLQSGVYAHDNSFIRMKETSIAVCGRAKGYGREEVTLLLIHKENGSVGYAAQTQTDDNGYYKFQFTSTHEKTSDYKVIVNRAGEVINDTITCTGVQTSFYADLNADFDGSKSKITAFVKKCFEGTENEAVLLLAQYDKNNKPINLSKTNVEVTENGNTGNIINSVENDTKYIKGYLWLDLGVMQPAEESAVYSPLPVYEKPDMPETEDIVISFLGDSITWGYGTTKQYHSYISDRINAQINNLGISGTTVTNAVENSFIERVREIPGDSDLIIVLGGVNDRNANVPIGQPGDIGQDTFYGAYDMLIKAIRRNYPETKLVVVTPLNSPDSYSNSALSIEEYAKSVIAVANENYVPVIDAYHELDLTGYFPDYLHPDETGHKLLADYIIEKLVEKNIINIVE